jgi:glyoxylase-like metal-dependent hydrolase (beta-lactamase superfamily II)
MKNRLLWGLVVAAGLTGAGVPLLFSSASARPVPGSIDEICYLRSRMAPSPPWLYVQEPLSNAPVPIALGSFLVRRGTQRFLVDSGLGSTIEHDYASMDLGRRLVFAEPTEQHTLEALARRQVVPGAIDFVFLTHAHWDHAGGTADLPSAPVRLSSIEWQWARAIETPMQNAVLPAQLDRMKIVEPFNFEGPPMYGFAASHDLFGDGTATALPLPGHTPGSTGLLLRMRSGRSVFLVGDAAWLTDNITGPRPHARFGARLTAWNREEILATLYKLHAFSQKNPAIAMVPAHDGRVTSAWKDGCIQ